MSISMIVFILLAIALIVILIAASQPPKRSEEPIENLFELLSRPSHCARISFIMRSLSPQDTAYLRKGKNRALRNTLRRQRRVIALHYLAELQEEFETLLEISRGLAVTAPEVVPLEELTRWRLSIQFAINCTILRWQLRFGLGPLHGFTTLSNMSIGMVRHLEAATSSIARDAIEEAEIADFERHEDGDD
ncbi:MAG TPA: hypothetical protein VL128_03420 [Candidatus Eisenbacteria bacterium]|nr:hypothetical protein [Candidatus Eisenbacteria bacterium]